ncbi:hypothetical protein FGO68_gene6179 [Halteria grandinella]|uniref:Uncharacterized protein n=1 Tax=Halteria grandinella TaxID=5974 RepID=A0A8J8NYF0_HALGN|nr:hypothetical protein FGO68_gene6179 [Halteria grandinella]
MYSKTCENMPDQQVCSPVPYLSNCFPEDSKKRISVFDRCKGVECQCDGQCSSGFKCKNQQCTDLIPASQSECNQEPSKFNCDDILNPVLIKSFAQRCDGVRCLCGNECISGYCNELLLICEDKPNLACNLTQTVTICVKTENIYLFEKLQAQNLCAGVRCNCDSDCQSMNCRLNSTQLENQCSNISRNELDCNQTGIICGYNAKAEIVNIETTNRCENSTCQFDEECKSSYCNQLKGICNIPESPITCNKTKFSAFFNGLQWNIGLSKYNLCIGVQCTCDNECMKGAYCNKLQGICQLVKEHKCNESSELCNYDYLTGASLKYVDTINRCENVSCSCDTMCESGYCNQENLICETILHGQMYRCNQSGSYCGYTSINKCNGVGCFCDNECQSGYCSDNLHCQPIESLIQQGCDNRKSKCIMDSNGNAKFFPIYNKCDGVVCSCDSECKQGLCSSNENQTQGYCKLQDQGCNATASKACLFDFKKDYYTNLCQGKTCSWDNDCQSEYPKKPTESVGSRDCYDRVCSDATMRLNNHCNKSLEIVVSKNYTTGILTFVSSISRCLNISCQTDNQCQSTYCKDRFCTECGMQLFCPGQSCSNDDQCVTEICYKKICQSISDCNHTVEQQGAFTSNRCLGTYCELDSDCQQFAKCKESKCTYAVTARNILEQNKSQSERTEVLSIIIPTIVGFIAIAFLIYCACRFLSTRHIIKVQKHAQTENNYTINKTIDESVEINKSSNQTEANQGRHSVIVIDQNHNNTQF